MRKRYTMTEEQYGKMIKACQPVPYLVAGGMEPRSQQQNANDAWASLGKELGFNPESVQPDGRDAHNFTAEAVQVQP